MFNLKYARTRQWLLYWVLTFIFFPVLIQFGELPESEQSESGLFLYLLFYICYSIFCFFRTIYYWTGGIEYIKDGYSKKFDPKIRSEFLMRSLLNSPGNTWDKGSKAEKLERELNTLIDKYRDQTGTKNSIRLSVLHVPTAQERKKAEKRENRISHGLIAGKVICPHCQVKGKVRRKVGMKIEETRQSGLVGGLIGQKTVTSKGNITRFYCENCGTKWTT
tara:strand:- start:91 stop:750 length:660 start_codon:yes stop_codon:yes gene_type:complete